MARAPVSALVFVILGMAAGLAGILMSGWAATTHLKVERGFDAAMWAMARSPLQVPGEPIAVANMMIQDVPVMVTAALGLVLCLVGYRLLRDARFALLPAGAVNVGRAEIVLAHPARAGQPLEGRLYLARAATRGEAFNVEVRCFRRVDHQDESDRPMRNETVHHEERATPAARDARGWYLPFRFDIPVTAPPSGGRDYYAYRWRVEFASAKAWITFHNGFDVQVDEAAERDMAAFKVALPPADEAEVDGLARDVAKFRSGPLLAHERAELRSLSPAKREEMRRIVASTGKVASGLQKAIVWFCAFVGGVVSLMFALGWALGA